MVALHNRKLTLRDIWPNNIWDSKDDLRVQYLIEAKLIDEGVDKGDFAYTFRFAREMENYRKQFGPGGMRHQQEVMKRIYPPEPVVPGFTEEEIEAIMDRFEMANDDLGRAIFEKAAALLGRTVSETPSFDGH